MDVSSPLLSLWRIPIVPLDKQCVPPSACPAAHGCPEHLLRELHSALAAANSPVRHDYALGHRIEGGCGLLLQCVGFHADALQQPRSVRLRCSTSSASAASRPSCPCVAAYHKNKRLFYIFRQCCSVCAATMQSGSASVEKGKAGELLPFHFPFISLSFPFHFPFPPLLTFL